MNEIFVQSLYIIGGYMGLFLSMLLTFNWLSKGMFWQWLIVRMSRGSKVLCIIHGTVDHYYRSGYFEKTNLHTKNRLKEGMLFVNVDPLCVYNALGVQCIELDELNNNIFTRDGSVVKGNDPVEADALYNRCLKKPTEASLLVKVVIAGLILGLLGLIVLGVLYYQNAQQVALILELLTKVTTPTGGIV